MKQTARNLGIFSAFALTAVLLSGACSSDPDTPLGGGNTFGGTTSTSTGGNPGSAGTSVFPQAGMTSSTAGTGTSAAGTGFGTAGTFGSAGTFSSAGTDTGGAATGGGGGANGGTSTGGGGAAAGGASGGTTGTGDFPANCPAPTGAHGATPLSKTCWKASATDCSNSGNNAGLQNPPSKALDADLATRFSTGAKITSDTMYKFDIDMGKAVMINGVSSNTPAPASGGVNDIPPMIEIDVSTDGTTWKPVACGANALMADISFAAVSARYVRFAAHGSADAWWSMVDVNVYGAGADTTCGADAGTPGCTSIGSANAVTCCGAVHTL